MRDDGGGVLVLVGELDSYTAPMLSDRLAAEDGPAVLDVSDVSFIDSSGLRVLVEVHQARTDEGSSLRLRAPSASVQHLLEISGLLGHFDVVE